MASMPRSCPGRAGARLPTPWWRSRRDPARRASLGAEAQRTSRRYDIATWVRKMERLYELMARVSKPTKRQGLLREDLSFLDAGQPSPLPGYGSPGAQP